MKEERKKGIGEDEVRRIILNSFLLASHHASKWTQNRETGTWMYFYKTRTGKLYFLTADRVKGEWWLTFFDGTISSLNILNLGDITLKEVKEYVSNFPTVRRSKEMYMNRRDRLIDSRIENARKIEAENAKRRSEKDKKGSRAAKAKSKKNKRGTV
jgi:hypothetical protein